MLHPAFVISHPPHTLNHDMKKTLALALMAALLAPTVATAQQSKEDPAEKGGAKYITGKAPRKLEGGWVLYWNDEFEGSKLDLTKWNYELGVVRNQGASQAYTKDCVKVRGGMLQLRSVARKTKNQNYDPKRKGWVHAIKEQPYASGSVTTRGVKHFTAPGRLEFRARIPKARGVWPAIWTMHVNGHSWPANGEIDLLEHVSQEPNVVYTIFRWGKNGTKEEYKPVIKTTNIPDYSKNFHTYVLEWDDEVMKAFIDEKEVARVDISAADYPDGTNPLRTPCYLIINTAIGGKGTWPESPVDSEYPVTFEIDYVRYYTKLKDGEELPTPSRPEPKKNKKRQ